MTSVRIQTGATEPITVKALAKNGSPLTGLTDLFIRIRRFSDGFFLDFADTTFKASPGTINSAALSEISATNAPGVYELSNGFDFSTITNAAADDTYIIIVIQTPGTNAVLPGPGEVKEGQYVDDIDAPISGRAAPGDAMDLVANAVDAAAIATDAIDADAIAADAIGSSELATSAVNEIRDAILDDATRFSGADIAAILADTAAIDARLPSDPADESLQQASHAQTQADIAALNDLSAQEVRDAMKLAPTGGAPAVGSVDEHLDDILADTAAIDGRLPSDPADESLQQASHTQTQADIAALNDLAIADVQTALTNQGYTAARAPNLDNLDATVSSRSDFDESTDPVELLDAGGAAGTSAAELVTDIEADLAANHGAGQWDGTDSDWTAAEREQIRFRLAMDGTQTDPTTGTGTLESILADTDAIDSRLPSDPADESLQQAAHTQTQADIAALNDLSGQEVRDAMKLAPTGGAPGAGSVDEHLDDILTDTADMQPRVVAIETDTADMQPRVAAIEVDTNEMQGKLPTNNIMGSSVKTDKDDEIDAILADTAAIDARLPADPADESNQLAQHTATQAAIAALNDPSVADIADGVWDEPVGDHQAAGSTGKALTDASATADPGAIADAVWDEAAGDHTAVGSMGEAQNESQEGANKIDGSATVDPGSATPGSLLDRLTNKDGSQTYDQSTDSLEGIRDRIG
jgi:hypothetical protein